MECTMADPHLVRQEQQRLQRRLAAVVARQQLALRRNRALRREFLQLEAHMETTGWHSIRKMEWYGREIQSLLSLREGSSSAGGDEEEGSSEQVLQAGGQAGIGASTAMPGELGRPAAELGCPAGELGHPTAELGRPGAELGCPGAELGHPGAELGRPAAAASVTGGLGSQQEPPLRSPSPELLSPDSGSTAGESEEEHGDLAASEESSEQLTSASSGIRAAPLRPGQRQVQVPGVKPSLSSWWAHREGSRAELPLPAAAEQEARPSVPGTRQEQGRDARAPEGSLLPPASPPTAQEEPLDSSAPHSPELPRLCRALQLLERLVERTSPRHRALYQGQPSGTAEPPSAGAGGPAQDDLEAMEAVVLRQLRAVVRHTRSGSVPPESGGAGQEEHTRDTEALRALLSHHGSFLKQHQVRLPEAVAEMFEQLLAPGEEEQDGQVLREALPGERGDGTPVQSDESSLGLPAIPTHGREGKQGELARREPGGDRGHARPEGSDSLGHWDSSSSLDGSAPPLSRTELRRERVTAIKSKAFWGESDDSSSELEAALRPQPRSADSDDFDDFYD
ncbi:centrosomal protein kizuna [Poecile atricapillus]|uniref:centrosomal protein kizuna n=1 Tax=Poecile atricapillus TaxID=48891 RepID=UPI00273A4244|nr:centrosomal protein kizuna [Poecile atricapillus]XP_058692986.1 centrosomal protein kizuna [Poecile atricapillus]